MSSQQQPSVQTITDMLGGLNNEGLNFDESLKGGGRERFKSRIVLVVWSCYLRLPPWGRMRIGYQWGRSNIIFLLKGKKTIESSFGSTVSIGLSQLSGEYILFASHTCYQLLVIKQFCLLLVVLDDAKIPRYLFCIPRMLLVAREL